ncbi:MULTISPECIES: hypothetical protein [Pectobacterium]|uniref:hypothetical protein n=1 Tax=Pectobacterium TaxID=122277 RepID=UPI000504E7D0|nr:hypothetical protein [Pectobacterium odoriferum]KGA31151.1 hypothetical protein KS43_19630 [Pectobacterium odoriferum]
MKTQLGIKHDVDVKVIKTCIKISDRFSAQVIDVDGNVIRNMDNEYVPDLFPGNHYGDYLMLEIDIETGHIRNWKKPSQQQLSQLVGEEEDD